MAFRVSNCAQVRSCHFRWIKLQQQCCRQMCFITGLYSIYCVSSCILCPMFHHTFYVLSFIRHSMLYVSSHSTSYDLSYILCPMYYHTFYVL